MAGEELAAAVGILRSAKPIFDHPVLRSAVARMLAAKGDALTLIPHFQVGSFWEHVMIPTWTWVLLMFSLLYRIGDPRSSGVTESIVFEIGITIPVLTPTARSIS